ncbi:MAG: DNA-binding protein [Candidatus Micrarchaeia archaeon]
MQEESAAGNDEEAKMQKALQKRLKAMQIEEQKKQVLRKVLEPAAYERLMNVRIANPELYQQLLDILIAMVQSNRIRGRVSEADFKNLLMQLTSRPESSIQIRHK